MEYELSGIEIYYLAQYLEINSLYGIGNPFYGLSTEEIDIGLIKASSELQIKKYVTEDFDGNVSVPVRLQKIISALSKFDLMISLETIIDGEYKLVYYFVLDGIVVKLFSSERELYELSEVSVAEVKTSIDEIVSSNLDVEIHTDDKMEIPLADLEYYRGRILDGDKESVFDEMREYSSDSELLDIYTLAIEKKLDYTGIIFHYNDDIDKGDTILYIKAAERMIAVQYDMVDYEDVVILRDISKQEIDKRIRMQLEFFSN